MCHAEIPAGQNTPEVAREEVVLPLPNGEQLPALLTLPKAAKAPAVLIANDVFGRRPFYEHLAARLADAGFVALCPEFFFREGPLAEQTIEHALARNSRLDASRALRELSLAVDWLKQHPRVVGTRVGTIGFCLGGTFGLLLASERDDLATVCFYGFPAGSGRGGGPALIPLNRVDAMHGPILGFWGDQDAGVGMENVRKLAAELESRHIPFDCTIYPGIGHGFLAASEFDPANETYAAAKASWDRTLDFLHAQLEAATPA